MRLLVPIIVLLAVGGLRNVIAAEDISGFSRAANDPFWVLQGGIEIDHEGGYTVSAGGSYLHSEQTTAAVNLGFSDSSANFANSRVSYVSALFDHSFGPVGGSLSAGWSRDTDVVERFRYGGSVYFQSGGFRLEFSGENWTSDFEPFRFSRLFDREPPLPPLLLSGTGECSLDNTAYGGRIRYGRGAWRVYAGGSDYDYSQADCAFSGMLGDIDLRNPPEVLADFSPIFFRRLTLATASQIIFNDTAFLDFSVSAGLSFQVKDRNLALDVYRSKEIFEGLTADTLIASILFPAGLRTDWEMRVGAAKQENSDVIVFVGATVYWYLD